MFAYIRGTVAALESDSVILDHQGIGYRIYVPSAVLAELSVGEERKLHTYFAVREDAMQLYGFLTADDLELFRLLIGVSGIGPKGALGILGVMSGDELRFAVLSEDAAGLSKAPGIGKKTAQKVIIELKDKLDLMDDHGADRTRIQQHGSHAGRAHRRRGRRKRRRGGTHPGCPQTSLLGGICGKIRQRSDIIKRQSDPLKRIIRRNHAKTNRNRRHRDTGRPPDVRRGHPSPSSR